MRWRPIGLTADRRLLYADASALVKLVVDEDESGALETHIRPTDVIATSAVARVEVARAARVADPSGAVLGEVDRLLDSCLLIEVNSSLLEAAASLSSREVRSLDAIHLASVLRTEPDEVLVYDRRLAVQVDAHGFPAASPGRRG